MSSSKVLSANKWIVDKELSILTWGNVSMLDEAEGLVLIKPSGADLNVISEDDISVVKLSDGSKVSGLNPSVDTETHLELYRQFKSVGAIAHTHSTYATSFAQAGRSIPCLGTTHADYFKGSIPCVPEPNEREIRDDYEKYTGLGIAKYFKEHDLNPLHIPAALVRGHGVFCWGRGLEDALQTAIILENVAKMAINTLTLNPDSSLSDHVLTKHFMRKNGDSKYYGQ